MKAIKKTDAVKIDAVPVGSAEVVVLPPSNVKAAAKGGWQSAGVLTATFLTFLTALWFDPTVAALIANVVKEHPGWAAGFTIVNFTFAYFRNRHAHRKSETRLAIVGEPK